MPERRRVVITGLGVVSPLGTGVELFWSGLLAGRSGVRRVTRFDASDLPCQIAGEVPDFAPEEHLGCFPVKERRHMPLTAQYALAAAYEAWSDAGLASHPPDPERVGVVAGTAIGGLDVVDRGLAVLRSRGYRRVPPLTLPLALPNVPAYAVSRALGLLGPMLAVSTACATGTQAIGEAVEIIRRGQADVMVAGGADAHIADYALGGFAAMRALPVHYNTSPERASRPFDAHREGFVFAEGAAFVVLEALDHALKRGAHIYAEVLGYGAAADAHHIAAPDPMGQGAQRAMRKALADAALQPTAVDYINAHGTSTRLNDAIETRAIKAVFGDHAYRLAVSSIKSMIGHAMGAAGALEAVACALTLHEGWLPPTINYEAPDPVCDLDYVPNQARQQVVRVALSNSFGLGGQNACLVFGAWPSSSAHPA